MSSRSVRRTTPERHQLIETHLPLARKLARRYGGRGEALDDLIQVGALGLIRASERFDPDRGASFSTFAARVIDGEIRRHLRSRPGMRLMAGEETPQQIRDPNESLGASDARALISESVRALDDRERRIVFLRFQADMTERQIGATLGISQAQVSRILNRALAKLKTELSDPDAGSSEGDIADGEVIPPDNTEDRADKRVRAQQPKRSEAGPEKGGTRATKSGGYSGRFLVRMPGELHQELARCAQEANLSLNRLVTDVLAASTSGPRASSTDAARPEHTETAQDEDSARTVHPTRALRLALAANLTLVLLTVGAAVILVVLALQRGI